MILKGNQRGSARELATHLLNGENNEHVTVHEIRGFVSDDLAEAFEEAYAISRGTRCKQFLFSLSLNPPEFASVPIEAFEAAIAEIEKVLGILDQPRAIVFHEKNGRRHCHVVWSRIYAEKMVAINLAHYKRKLTAFSRQLYLRHGWDMPPGLKKDRDKNKTNFTLGEWQQAERCKENPRALKEMFLDCWARSDNRAAFAKALEERGYYLARGDQRGYVAVDFQGEIYALNRWLNVKNRDLKARLGDKETLPSVEQARAFLQERMTARLQAHLENLKADAVARRAPLIAELSALTARHKTERQELMDAQRIRWETETRLRAGRLSRGLRGIMDFLTGKYQNTRNLNESETRAALERDGQEQHHLLARQIVERQHIQKALVFYRQEHHKDLGKVRAAIAGHVAAATAPLPSAQKNWRESAIAALADQLARIQAQIEALSGDIGLLQASLESHLLPDHLKAKIRALIEQAKEALRIKYQQQAQNAETQRLQAEQETEKIQKKQAELFALMQQQEKLQKRWQAQQAYQAESLKLYQTVIAMPYKLNGVPLYEIKLTVNPKVKFDEKLFIRELHKEPAQNLLRSVKIPECPVTELRQNVLQMKEILRRAKSSDSSPHPETKNSTTATKQHLNHHAPKSS